MIRGHSNTSLGCWCSICGYNFKFNLRITFTKNIKLQEIVDIYEKSITLTLAMLAVGKIEFDFTYFEIKKNKIFGITFTKYKEKKNKHEKTGC